MNDLILATIARGLIPFILVYGAYVTTNGHLSPGGGFSGGTICAAAVILAVLAWGLPKTGVWRREGLLCGLESIGLLGYLGAGMLAWLTKHPYLTNLAAGLPSGLRGALLSSGLVWVLGAMVGIKVGVSLIGIFNRVNSDAEEAGHV